ncbi:MAG: ATP-binding cassette domain-containing protein [Candidatus Moduliflexus flocculans]|nr:ATP-binding cassette domain-containing protein [Candidatus Moduliflexus flocculans]
MIDPAGRSEILDRMDALAASGATVIHVTHDMDEAARALPGRGPVGGRVAFDGTPEELFRRGTWPPWAWPLRGPEPGPGSGPSARGGRGPGTWGAGRLRGPPGRDASRTAGPGTRHSARARPARRGGSGTGGASLGLRFARFPPSGRTGRAFSYLSGTPQERRALTDIDLGIPRGGRVALVGATGSGKSSLLQLLSALAFPQKGRVLSFGIDTSDPKADRPGPPDALPPVRPASGIRPSSSTTRGTRFPSGPATRGSRGPPWWPGSVPPWRPWACPSTSTGTGPCRSLSGGQKRRLALASVLAMEPEALLLDEPGSALDSVSRERLMGLVYSYGRKGGTVVFATHSMEEAARADLVVVLAEGRLRPREPRRMSSEPGGTLLGPRLAFGARAAEGAREAGLALPEGIVDEAGLIRALADLGTGRAVPRIRGASASRTAGEAGA